MTMINNVVRYKYFLYFFYFFFQKTKTKFRDRSSKIFHKDAVAFYATYLWEDVNPLAINQSGKLNQYLLKYPYWRRIHSCRIDPGLRTIPPKLYLWCKTFCVRHFGGLFPFTQLFVALKGTIEYICTFDYFGNFVIFAIEAVVEM